MFKGEIGANNANNANSQAANRAEVFLNSALIPSVDPPHPGRSVTSAGNKGGR